MSNETPYEELLKMVKKEARATGEAVGSPETGRRICEQLGISAYDVLNSVSVSALLPDCTETLIHGFAAGSLSSDEQTLAETLLEIHPELWSDVRIFREEIAEAVGTNLVAAQAKRSVWSSLGIFASARFAWGVGAAACLALGALYVQSGMQLDQKQSQFAVAALDLHHKIDSLGQRQLALTEELAKKNRDIARLGTRSSPAPDTIAVEGDQKLIRMGDAYAMALPKNSALVQALKGPIAASATPSLGSAPVSAQISGFDLVSPDRTAIATQRPQLTWKPPTGSKVDHYEVMVSSADSSKRVKPINAVAARLQIAAGLLRPGGVYVWWVKAVAADGEEKTSNTGRFAVLDEKSLREAQHILSDSGVSHLERALYAAKAGLLDDAEQQLAQVQIQDRSLKNRIQAAIDAARKHN